MGNPDACREAGDGHAATRATFRHVACPVRLRSPPCPSVPTRGLALQLLSTPLFLFLERERESFAAMVVVSLLVGP